MSALVCRKRSNYVFDEIQFSPPLASKRIRCSAGTTSPPTFFTPPDVSNSGGDNEDFLNHLRKQFPHLEQQYLERALEASGNDLDSAISSLNDIFIEPVEKRTDERVGANAEILSKASEESTINNIPKDGSEWVDLLVREMMNSSGIEDARARVFRALDVLEKSIAARANVETTKNFSNNESVILKEQVKLLLGENSILKKAVAIQHQRQKDYEEKNQELQNLKQLLSQYQEQLRKLEVNNYALAMHLRQAQQSSIPGRFHPDIF